MNDASLSGFLLELDKLTGRGPLWNSAVTLSICSKACCLLIQVSGAHSPERHARRWGMEHSLATMLLETCAKSSGPSEPHPTLISPKAMMSGDTMPAGAKTGADFQLVQLTVVSGNRQADMGKLGSQGGKLKNSIDCDQERIASGYYRLHPKQPLKAGGEYAFFFQNSANADAGGTAWAFGVDPT